MNRFKLKRFNENTKPILDKETLEDIMLELSDVIGEFEILEEDDYNDSYYSIDIRIESTGFISDEVSDLIDYNLHENWISSEEGINISNAINVMEANINNLNILRNFNYDKYIEYNNKIISILNILNIIEERLENFKNFKETIVRIDPDVLALSVEIRLKDE